MRRRILIRKWMTACLSVAIAAAVVFAGTAGTGSQVWAQEGQDDEQKDSTGLGVRQQQVEQMMQRFESRFRDLAEKLEATEPERAKRLVEALQKSREMLLEQRMSEITKLLNNTKLTDATAEQQAVLDDLKSLIQLLLAEDDVEEKLSEWEKLQEWKDRIRNILDEEKRQEQESERVADQDQTLEDLAQKIAAIKSLIDKQKKNLKDTQSAREETKPIAPLAKPQQEIREAAEAVAGKAASKGGMGQGGMGEGGMGEGGMGEGGMGEGGMGEGGMGEGGMGEGGMGEGGMGGESKPLPPKAKEALDKAIQNQKQAEKELGEQRGKPAEESQADAVENLETALAELEKEKDRIARLPPELFEELAKEQDKTSDRVARLSEDMKKEGGGEGEGGMGEGGMSEGGMGEGGKKKPGQESVEQAQKSMQQASKDLREKNPKDAGRKQREAIKALEKALEDIEKRLAQLREETQVEKLARLEARFREMLARQQVATIETAELEAKKKAGELTRPDRLAIAKIAAEERELAAQGQLAYDILVEDGTSIVFPIMTEAVTQDLEHVAKLLDDKQTGALTAVEQSQIESALEELIAALEQAQKQAEMKQSSSGGGEGGPPKPESLLPNSAELKLLKSTQLRVRTRTEAIAKIQAEEGESPVFESQLEDLAGRQRQLAEMTFRILERSYRAGIE
jgi:DNA repair exonuclease SbcCD ATPase subunit